MAARLRVGGSRCGLASRAMSASVSVHPVRRTKGRKGELVGKFERHADILKARIYARTKSRYLKVARLVSQ